MDLEDNVEKNENISSHEANAARRLELTEVPLFEKEPAVEREIRQNKKETMKNESRKQDDSMIDEPKWLLCHVCDKSFANQKTLRRHLLLCVLNQFRMMIYS